MDRSLRARRGAAGFTLVELLIVVAILGLLASLALVGYRRYVARARVTEAVSILSEMVSKEQVYFLEFGAFLPLRRDNVITMPSANEDVAAFYPVSPSATTFESARTATSIANPALWPGGWRSVGLRPRVNQLYCTYLVNAGLPGNALPASNSYALGALGPQNANSPAWFYGLAACNLAGPAGYPNQVTVLGVSSTRTGLQRFNDGM